MRIGIDARLYGIQSGTGIGRYVEELIRELAPLDQNRGHLKIAFAAQLAGVRAKRVNKSAGIAGLFRVFLNALQPNASQLRQKLSFEMASNHYTVFLRRDAFDSFVPPNERWTKVLADFRPYTMAVQLLFPRLIRKQRLDSMHFTHFDHPLLCPVPFIITIHDLILLKYPSRRASLLGPMRFGLKYLSYRIVLRHAIKKSRIIITPSESVRQEIRQRFCAPLQKIIATSLGVEHVKRIKDEQSPTPNYQLPTINSQFVLYIGNAYPHKNLEQLIRVWPSVLKQHPQLKLVLVGREDYFYCRLRNQVRDRTQIVFFGPAAELELVQLLSGAVFYISPSLDEGFDLPTIEACAYGTPVVATDIPVHREVLGDAALLIPVKDDQSLIQAIHRVLVDNSLRVILKQRGINRVQGYTWNNCACKTLAIYQSLLKCGAK